MKPSVEATAVSLQMVTSETLHRYKKKSGFKKTNSVISVDGVIQRSMWVSLLAYPTWWNTEGWEILFAHNSCGRPSLATTSVSGTDDGNFFIVSQPRN